MCRAQVFKWSPLDGRQINAKGPGAGGKAKPSKKGWLVKGSPQYGRNITGNNVRAYIDADNNNQTDLEGGAIIKAGKFAATATLSVAPNANNSANREVAVQNLFYFW